MIELVGHDRDDEDYLCRKYAENHPVPPTFTRCNICVNVCTIVRRKRLGWVAPRPEPMTPPSPEEQRTGIERRLAKLEAEAAKLGTKLEDLPPPSQ
jgi:hypothetical protein